MVLQSIHIRRVPYLTTGYKGAIRGTGDTQNGVPVGEWLYLCGQVEGHLLGSQVRVFLLCVLKLHVRTELVPRDVVLRGPVNLHEQGINLGLLSAIIHGSY